MNPKLLARLLAHLRETGYPAADLKALEADVAQATARTATLEQSMRRMLIDEPLRASLEALGLDVKVGGVLDAVTQLVERDFAIELVEHQGRFVAVIEEGSKRLQVDELARELVKRHELLRRHVDPKRKGKPTSAKTLTAKDLDEMSADELIGLGWQEPAPVTKRSAANGSNLEAGDPDALGDMSAGFRTEPKRV
jgi:hypothetical protein